MSAEIEGLISRIVAQQLSGAAVETVSVRQEIDDDGDDILRIVIVLDRKPSVADQAKMLGLVRHLRSGLAEAASRSFPLLSFVSKQDARTKLAFEAA